MCSVGGGAAAIFNTRASKPPKLSVVGLVLVLEQTFVSSLRQPHYTHIRKITDQQLGRGGGGVGGGHRKHVRSTDPDFQSMH